MLQESDSGVTVSPEDANELTEKLIYLANNKSRALEMGKNAFVYAQRNFDKDFLSEKMIMAIEDIIQ